MRPRAPGRARRRADGSDSAPDPPHLCKQLQSCRQYSCWFVLPVSRRPWAAPVSYSTNQPRRTNRLQPGSGVGYQQVDHGLEAFLAIGAVIPGLGKSRDLAMGAGAPLDDVAQRGHLLGATKCSGILGGQLEQFLQQFGEWHQMAAAQIEQPFIIAV